MIELALRGRADNLTCIVADASTRLGEDRRSWAGRWATAARPIRRTRRPPAPLLPRSPGPRRPLDTRAGPARPRARSGSATVGVWRCCVCRGCAGRSVHAALLRGLDAETGDLPGSRRVLGIPCTGAERSASRAGLPETERSQVTEGSRLGRAGGRPASGRAAARDELVPSDRCPGGVQPRPWSTIGLVPFDPAQPPRRSAHRPRPIRHCPRRSTPRPATVPPSRDHSGR